ncbi:MAG TPA: hypothetical protein ENH03_00940 [Candidatus Bathyarchaeota archaeon]|nr:hypothetical protein [Candidatus Bathyarchaeota archaeon]
MFEVEQLCERIAIMRNGRIIVDSPPSVLREMLRDIHAVEVEIKGANNLPKILQSLSNLPIVRRIIETRNDPFNIIIRLQVDDEYEAIPMITSKLHSLGVKVLSIRRSEPSLEDVFVKLAKREAV